MKLTEETVRTLVVPEQATDKVFWDDALPCFGVRVYRSGKRSWVIQYAIEGRTRHITIGSIDLFKLTEARARVKKLLAKVRLGADPAADVFGVDLEQRIVRKALMFLDRNIEPECYLYRHYHPNGGLLYVGVSLEPLRRQDSHLKAATWRDMICRILIEPFDTREEALAAETIAIRTEFPKFNLIHNRRRHPFQELSRKAPKPEIE
jgi:Arm DNA-binding domain